MILTAAPGGGKTFLSLYICAAVSDGRAFIGDNETCTREPKNVIYQTAEDGLSDTLKPRLEAIIPSPNYRNIYNIEEESSAIQLKDTKRIEEALRELNPALIIFDPIQAYLGAEVDMNRANAIRPIMARIGILAEKYACTFLFIMHNTKMKQASALNASLGSIDIPGVSRSMLMLDINPQNPNQLILCHTKSSLSRHGKSIVFHLEDGNIVFDSFSDLSADDVYSAVRKRKRDSSELEDAKKYLNTLLNQNNGVIQYSKVNEAQLEHLFSSSTLYRAKKELHLKSITFGFKDKVTFWHSPTIDENELKNRFQGGESLQKRF